MMVLRGMYMMLLVHTFHMRLLLMMIMMVHPCRHFLFGTDVILLHILTILKKVLLGLRGAGEAFELAVEALELLVEGLLLSLEHVTFRDAELVVVVDLLGDLVTKGEFLLGGRLHIGT